MKNLLCSLILFTLCSHLSAFNILAKNSGNFFSNTFNKEEFLIHSDTNFLHQPVQLSYNPPTHWNENDHTSGFHLGGFALGLFVPIAGIFIAKMIGGKAKNNRKKWAIIGSAITLGLILIIIKSLSTKY